MKLDSEGLLNLDIEKIFQSQAVADIKNVQKDLQLEIEKKREELRSTVGERYRDLLKAADTITNMRETSGSVVSSISQITDLCQALQEKRLLGFKQPTVTKGGYESSEKLSKMLEVKMLLNIPELIWLAIDDKKFARAAEYYLLAAHTHLGLQVNRAVETYPLLTVHWDTIISCRNVILESARKELLATELSPKNVSDCLTCLLLLETSTLEEILDLYMNLRSQAFSEGLISDDNPTVKEKLRAAALLVQHTLSVACHCFLGREGKLGLIENHIGELTAPTSSPTFSLLPQSPIMAQHLSAIVKDYRPSTVKPIHSLSTELVRDRLEKWLEKIREILQSEMSNLLGLIPNLRGVLGVRERVSTLPIPTSWNIVEEVLGETFNVYSSLLEPYVTERTLRLVSNVWNAAIQNMTAELAAMDEELLKDGKESNASTESNLRWFLWKESESEDIGLKTKGFTPRVVRICNTLDGCLEALLEDVNIFLAGVTDKIPLLEYLNSCSFETIERFVVDIKNSARDRDMAPNESCILIRAKILMAMTTKCPNLKKCMRQSDPKVSGQGRSWSEMVTILSEASIAVWRTWKEFIEPQLKSLVSEKLDSDVSVATFLVSRPACEVIIITEEAEDNKTINSEIRVPSQPSFTLQELLLQISWKLNSIAVHTLPRVIHQEVIQMVSSLIFEHYEQLISNGTIYQSFVWQLLLDIRFMSLLFVSRDGQSKAQELCERLETVIDPFDMNVYHPYLQAIVKKSALRLQGTFGVLVDFSEKLPVLNSLKVIPAPQNSSAAEEPNVLAMSSNVPWFPLLPVSSGGNRKKEDSPSKQIKQKEREAKKESASSEFVRSAGAFFGAMTGGWS